MAAAVPLASSALTFAPPRVTLRDTGCRAALLGHGPPVVFSSGLYGGTPRRMYAALLRELARNATIVVLDEPLPVTAAVVDDVASTLAVEQVGLFSHSSVDLEVLDSPRVRCAVLCDPVVAPRIVTDGRGDGARLLRPVVANEIPVLKLHASRAYDGGDAPPIPELLTPRTPPRCLRTRRFADAGHADLLDDAWAELGTRSIPWMRGAVVPPAPYGRWRHVDAPDGCARRREYRREVAREALAHLLDGCEPSDAA